MELGEGAEADAALPRFAGGQVATAALALARLGCRVAYRGAVGDDAAAAQALAPLETAGVDCSGVRRVAGGRTRTARVRVDPASGEREVVPERDPQVAVRPGDLDASEIAAARVLHVDAEDLPASLHAAELAGAAGVPVVLDVDAPVEGWADLLARVDFPIVPRPFAEAIAKGSARGGLLALAKRTGRLAVVTLGAGGAIACAAGTSEVLASPAFAVAVRDTTGAGDAFHAGFIWGLLEGLDVAATLRAANAVAALNCTALGAQGGLPDRRTLEAFLAAEPQGDPT